MSVTLTDLLGINMDTVTGSSVFILMRGTQFCGNVSQDPEIAGFLFLLAAFKSRMMAAFSDSLQSKTH